MSQPVLKQNPHFAPGSAKSSWIFRLWALDVCLAVSVTVLIWFKFILPLLPPTRWIRYLLTPVGVVILYCISEILISNLLTDPFIRSTQNKHDRVLRQAGSTEES